MRKVWVVAAQFVDYEWDYTAHIAVYENEADAKAEHARLSVLLPERMQAIRDDERRIDNRYFDSDAISHEAWQSLKQRALRKNLKGTGISDDFSAYRAGHLEGVRMFWLPFFAKAAS